MKFNKIIVLCIAALILAVTPVVIAEVQRNAPITIKTELKEGEFVSRVKLSRGELYFKTQEELTAQLTSEDVKNSYPTASDYHNGDVALTHIDLDGVKEVSREEMMELMNIHPEMWQISTKCGGKVSEIFIEPSFYVSENGEYEYADFYMFSFHYGGVSAQAETLIFIAPSPVKWSLTSSREPLAFTLGSLRMEYGDLDSKIGDTVISVVQTDRGGYHAFFTIQNAAYEVLVSGLTQREFTELLISICEAPHPETQNVIDYVLQQ